MWQRRTIPRPDRLWNKFWNRARRALEHGDVEGAERYLLAAVGVASERCPGCLEQSLRRLAEFYRTQGRREEAATVYTRLEDGLELASMCEESGDFHEAEKILHDTLHRCGQGADDTYVREVLERLALLYMRLERYDEAEETWLQCISLEDEADSTLHAGRYMAALAEIAEVQGSLDEAEALLREVLESEWCSAPPLAVHRLPAVAALGRIVARQRRHHEAEALLRSALVGLKNDGSADLLRARILSDLARLCRDDGRASEAGQWDKLQEEAVERWAEKDLPALLRTTPSEAARIVRLLRSTGAIDLAARVEARAREQAPV